MLIFIVRKSQCTEGNAKERRGATTAGHKRKQNHPVTTHNSKIPVVKSAPKRTMTAKDFDRIHQKNFNKLVVIHTYLLSCVCKYVCTHVYVHYIYVCIRRCVCKNLCTCKYACRDGRYIYW